MYLFSRRTRLTSFAGAEWANNIAAKATEITGNETQVWGSVYSPGYGTITWTAWNADLASLEAFGDKIQVDPGYLSLVSEGGNYTDGHADDGLLQVVHGQPDPDRPVTYVGSVQAVIAGGNTERALTAGVELAQKAEAITGLPTLFGTSLTGPYGGVGWLTGYENIEAMEKAQGALAADSGWLKLVDSTDGCFVEDPSATQQTIHRLLS